MKQLDAIFGTDKMFYCDVPVPPINDHKVGDFEFTTEQKEGYGQSQLHPSIVYFPNKWNGHNYWMAATPYPNALGVFENACIYYADDNADGTPPCVFTPINGTPVGEYNVVNNPVVKVSSNTATNSDPDLLYDADLDELLLVTRDNNSAGYADAAYIQRTKDGQAWTPRSSRVIDTSIKGGGGQPSWIKVNGKYRFWYDSGEGVARVANTGQGYHSMTIIEGTSLTDIATYNYVKRCNIIGHSDIEPYHSDVFIDEKTDYYYLITCANNYSNDNVSQRYIYLAESKDKGDTWYMYARPLLGNCAKCNNYYRPTAFIRQSDRMLIVYWSTISGVSNNVADYPSASAMPIDGKTIGLSYDNFDKILNVLKEDKFDIL